MGDGQSRSCYLDLEPYFIKKWSFSVRLNYCTIFSKQEIITFKSNPVLSNSSDLPSVTRTEDLNSNIGRLQHHNDTAHSPNHPQYVGLVIVSALSEQTTQTVVQYLDVIRTIQLLRQHLVESQYIIAEYRYMNRRRYLPRTLI